MKGKVKRFILMFVVIFAMLQIKVTVVAAVDVTNATLDFYVNDFAGIFTEEEKEKLIQNAVDLEDNYDGIQVVITTVTSLDGNEVEDYANSIYNQYGIGKDDMGVLILLSTGDRELRIETGMAMEAYINDAKAGRIMDKYAIPYLKENDFSQGLISLQTNLINEIKTSVDEKNSTSTVADESNVSAENTQNAMITSERKLDILNFIGCFCIILAICTLVGIAIFLIYKKVQTDKERIKKIQELEQKLNESKLYTELLEENARKELERNKEIFEKQKESICIRAKEKENEIQTQARQEKKLLEKKIEKLAVEKRKIEGEYATLQKQNATLQDRYKRALILYPSVDCDIDEMIAEEIRKDDMQKASEVDSVISTVIGLVPNKDIISDLRGALNSYNSLEERQKAYVSYDISIVKGLLTESEKLKEEYERIKEEERRKKEEERCKRLAEEAKTSVMALISKIKFGKADDIKNLQKAKEICRDLEDGVKYYFDNSIIQKVYKLYEEAEADYKEKERINKKKKVAEAALATITGIISYIGIARAKDLKKLKEAKAVYDNLDSEAKEYFDNSVLDKLEDLIRQAKRDKQRQEEEERARKRREEEEERRRRNSSYSSHHSSLSSVGYSGYGGRSGGGGASRKF